MLHVDLGGKVALVTGAGGQLGRVIARTLGECGADVAANYLGDEETAMRVTKDIRGLGRKAMAIKADITDENSVVAMKEAINAGLGNPDVVVTCAVAAIPPWTPVLDQALEGYESQWKTSVIQSVLLAKHFLPAMIARKQGRYIAINTDCTMACNPGQSAYAAAKGGMNRALRSLAREVGEHGITVNEVAPGWVISDRERKGGVESPPHYADDIPLGRRGEDNDIANAVAFLASDLAGFITGVYLPVCGGFVMPTI